MESKSEHGVEFCHREHVSPDWIDYNGHLNVAYFVLVFDHATDAALEQLGLDENYRQTTGCSVFVSDMRVSYFREVMAYEELWIRSRLLSRDAKRVVIRHQMFCSRIDQAVASNEVTCVHVDLSQRRSTPWPPAVADRLTTALGQEAEHPQP